MTEIEDFAPPTAEDFSLGRYLRYLDRKAAGTPWRPARGAQAAKPPLFADLIAGAVPPMLRYVFP